MNIKLLLKLFLVSMLLVSASHARKLSKSQLKILKIVKSVAKQTPNKHGQTFENTAMAICLAETSAGVFRLGDVTKNRSVLKSSFGIMQMKVSTARFVAKAMNVNMTRGMSDLAIANKLMGDDRFNAKMSVLYLNWLSRNTKDYHQMISRYNGGNKNKIYIRKVNKYMKLLKSNKSYLI